MQKKMSARIAGWLALTLAVTSVPVMSAHAAGTDADANATAIAKDALYSESYDDVNTLNATITVKSNILKVKKNDAAQAPKPSKVVASGVTLKLNKNYTLTYQKYGSGINYAKKVDTLPNPLYNQHKAYFFLTAFCRILREISHMKSMLYPKTINIMMSIACGDRKRGVKTSVFRTLAETGGKRMRQLEELNLVDDFLVNSLTSHQVYGEPAARCILECILGRKIGKLKIIPQRIMQGEDTDRHGIRMDVYLDEEDGELFDLEPDNNRRKEDVAALPKRARFYHAKLDAGSFKSGEEYGVLRNVYVIFIMTYDPFEADRMVYTIKNGCVEMPELSYEDGARTIFLYTKGTEGNPPEDLRELLYYMEHTSEENAKTEDLQRLHEMVTAVKRDRKVGLTYMKSFEIEQRIRREGFDEGIAQGMTQGITQGITKGKIDDILDLLGDLGDIPFTLKEQIAAQEDETILRAWVKLAAKAKSIEEFLASMESSVELLDSNGK